MKVSSKEIYYSKGLNLNKQIKYKLSSFIFSLLVGDFASAENVSSENVL